MYPTILSPFRNGILASLPPSVITLLRPHLKQLKLKVNQTLHDADEPVHDIYFLETGICSMVVSMKDSRTVEAGIVGREGFVGMAAVLGGGSSAHRAFIQVGGSGYRINASILQARLPEPSGELRASLLRGVQDLLALTAQSVACNRLHEIEERLSRWLLMTQARVESDEIPLTHEFLAMMLGTRRSSVSLAAEILQKADLIDYKRGKVTIKNRQGLEETACECFTAIQTEYHRLSLL